MPTEDPEVKLKYYQDRLDKVKTLPDNKRLVLSFDEFNRADSLKPYTRANYIRTLLPLLEYFPNRRIREVKRFNKEDIVKYINHISDIHKKATAAMHLVSMFKMFKWLNNGERPDCIKGLKYIYTNDEKVMPEDVLKPEEIKSMIDAAEDAEEKAIIAVGFETGSRIGEFSNIKIRDIVFGENGATISVSGKTGQRVLFLYDSLPYLKAWLESYPYNKKTQHAQKDEYLWITMGGEKLRHYRLNLMLKRIAKNAGIEKNVYFHLLRHSQATVSAGYLTAAEMCVKFGWSRSSDMPERYTHLSQTDIQKKEKERRGLLKIDESGNVLAPKICPRCQVTNTHQAKTCSKCFFPLDKITAQQVWMQEKVLKKLVENKKIAQIVEAALKDMKKS